MKRGGVLVAGVVSVGLMLVPSAGAKVFTVTKTADTAPNGCGQGGCTLREAVIAANNHAGPDRVFVKSSKTYELAILGTGEDASLVGDLDATGKLQIHATGNKRATIDAAGIDGTIDAFADLLLWRIVVRGGSSAGIDTVDADLLLTGSVVMDNTSYGVRTAGSDGSVGLAGSRISGNDYQGIQQNSNGGILLFESSVSNNDFQGIQQNAGGGVRLLAGSSVNGNEHQGIQQYADGGVLLEGGSSVSDNGNQGIQEYDGGGIILRRSRVEANTHQGIQEYDDGKVVLVRSHVDDGESFGVQTYDAGGLTINKGTVSGNDSQGAYVFGPGKFTARGATIAGNGGYGLSYGATGGFKITDSNIARNGHGIYVEQDESATITDSTIERNVGDDGGAGIFLAPNSSLKLTGSTVARNTTEGSAGGGISVEPGAELHATNSTFSGNRAFLSGGAIWLAGAGASAELNGVTIARNVANYTGFSINSGGGGVGATGGATYDQVRNTLFALNKSPFGAVAPDCYANLGSGGHNLLTNDEFCSGLIGSDDEIGNPKIGQLRRNGGATKTIALKNGSPAIGAAGNDAPKRDQRGRKRDGQPDVGAFER